MDTTDLLNSTDDLIERLYTATWKGSLRFPGCVLCKEDTHYDEKAAGDVDIFELLGDKMYKSWIIRYVLIQQFTKFRSVSQRIVLRKTQMESVW